MSEHPTSHHRPSAGSIALTLMGWLEIAVSLVLFLKGIYAAAAVFAVVSLLVQITAAQIRRPAWDTRPLPEPAEVTPEAARRAQVAAGAVMLLGFASVAGAGLYLSRGLSLPALVLGLWALALGLQAWRLRAARR